MKFRKIRKIGFYDYTVILTYLGLLCACFGIFEVLGGRWQAAILWLMTAGVCDMFDGTVAKTKMRTPAEKAFGIQIDSLSDLVSFGVLPALFVYEITDRQSVSGCIAALYILAALIRLAYFNVLESQRQQEQPEQKSGFLGVPVTTICILLPVVYILFDNHIFRNTALFPLLLFVTGLGFLTPVKIKKPNAIGKIALIMVGAMEAVGVLLFMGWDAV